MTLPGSDKQTGVTANVVTWLGHLLMQIVASEDTRVRSVIANAVTATRMHDELHSGMRRRAGHPNNH